MSEITNNVYELMSADKFAKLKPEVKARAIIENCFPNTDLDDPWCGIMLAGKSGKQDILHRNFRVSIDWEHLGWIYEEADKEVDKDGNPEMDRGIHIYDAVVQGFVDMLHDQIIEEVKA